MGSHDPFGYLEHKLWPKKWSKVKSSIWLLTIKSREFPWFTCVQVAFHTPLKRSQWGLQLCLRPDLNRRFTQKVMGFQSHGNPNFKNLEIPNLGNPGQNDIWVHAPWPNIENTIRGRWWLPPSSGYGESCESMFACGSSMHQKCSNYAIINLLFGLQVRVNNSHACHSS
jgi:hypothetical protein